MIELPFREDLLRWTEQYGGRMRPNHALQQYVNSRCARDFESRLYSNMTGRGSANLLSLDRALEAFN